MKNLISIGIMITLYFLALNIIPRIIYGDFELDDLIEWFNGLLKRSDNMKKENQKQIALNRINLLLKNASTAKSNLYFQFADDYISDMSTIGVFTDGEAKEQYRRIMVYWKEWKDSNGGIKVGENISDG